MRAASAALRLQPRISYTCRQGTSTTVAGAGPSAHLVAPVIRLGSDASSPSRRALGAEIHAACRDIGFFQVTGHGIDRGRMLEETSNFFSLDDNSKDAISIRHSSSWRGYQRVHENVTQDLPDWHEALDLYSESSLADGSAHAGHNLWPKEVPKFREATEQYVSQMCSLGADLMRLIALGLQLPEDHFDRHFNDSFWGMRAIRYPAQALGDGLGVGEHTDYGCLTLLTADDQLQGGSGSLQVRNKQGDWVHLVTEPDAVICNIGDMLARWTNGLYRSTPHRVLRPQHERLSVPFFFEPNYDAIVEPDPHCVRLSGLPPCQGPVKYGDHLLSKTSTNFTMELPERF